jgi:hypothetical protein
MLDGQSEPGGSIVALSADGTSIALKQVYPRPVAIGFRAVSQVPLATMNDKILPDDAPPSQSADSGASTLQREEKKLLELRAITVGVRAQADQSAPAPNGARELECDDLCIKVGLALNQDVTTMQSKSGTGRGVVTKVPLKSRDQLK